MYVTRHADKSLQMISKIFGAVLVTGARQVGKTKLLREIAGESTFVTLDDHEDLVTLYGNDKIIPVNML